MITIIMVLVLVVVLAVYYCWSTETAASLMEIAMLESTKSTASSVSVTATTTKKHFTRNGVKQYLRKAVLEEQLEDITLPHKSNHLFSEATCGEWNKYGYSHYGKKATLHDYRRGNHLSKKCLHPCMGGESGDRFD